MNKRFQYLHKFIQAHNINTQSAYCGVTIRSPKATVCDLARSGWRNKSKSSTFAAEEGQSAVYQLFLCDQLHALVQ